MIDTLRNICALQPEYSAANTPAMKTRGELIRQTLPSEIRQHRDELRQALGTFADEFDVDASDGIGRKTEAPWVRVFDHLCSLVDCRCVHALVAFGYVAGLHG